MLVVKLVSPPYVALRLWLAVLSVLEVKLAAVTPPLVARGPVPSVFKPSAKVTVPVGLATAVLPGELTLTVAVKVTDWPETDGLAGLLSEVVVPALLTEREAVPVLPLSVAVTVWFVALDGVHVAARQDPSGAIANVLADVTSPRLLLN